MTERATPQDWPTDRCGQVCRIADWLLAGMPRSRIPRYARTEGATETAEQLDAMTTEAEAQILADAAEETGGAELSQQDALAIRRLTDLFAAARRDGDVRAALAVMRELEERKAALPVPAAEPLEQPAPPALPEGAALLELIDAEFTEVRVEQARGD